MYDSVVRTLVPLVAGALISQAARLGPDLPAGAVTELVTVLITAGYYVTARLLEKRRPRLGRLLLSFGLSRSTPAYLPAGLPPRPHHGADVRLEDGPQDVPQEPGSVVESEVPDGLR